MSKIIECPYCLGNKQIYSSTLDTLDTCQVCLGVGTIISEDVDEVDLGDPDYYDRMYDLDSDIEQYDEETHYRDGDEL